MPKAGSINHLKQQTEEFRPPMADQVCIAVRAIGLNFADVFAMQGLYSATPEGPFIPVWSFQGRWWLWAKPCRSGGWVTA